MSRWNRDLRKLWPLALLAFLILILGYAGFWPAFPLASNRFAANKVRLDGDPNRGLVEWIAKVDPTDQDLTADGTEIRLEAIHSTVVDVGTSSQPSSRSLVSKPQISHVGQSFFCVWQVQELDHPQGSVDIFGSWSTDGEHWSPSELIFSHQGDPSSRQLLRTAPLLSINGEVYVIARVDEVVGYGSADATKFSESKSAEQLNEFPQPVHEIVGYFVRRVLPNQTLGPRITLLRRSGEAYSVADAMRGLEIIDQGLIPDIVRSLATSDSRFGGNMEFLVPEVETEDRYRLSYPTEVQLTSNRRLRLWSSEQGLDRLYRQISDDDGRTWDKPVATNLRNGGTFAVLGTLPAGPVFLVGNQYRVDNVVADPLTISIAFENLQFTECYVLRRGTQPRSQALDGLSQRDINEVLGYQVGSCLIREEFLWVAYSVQGESIQVSRIRCRNLAPALVDHVSKTEPSDRP